MSGAPRPHVPWSRERYDAVVVGAGPNGLAAAVTLARAGASVLVLEGGPTPGGGARSAALTLPGFVHDVCASVFPLGVASPVFRALPLAAHGLEWVQPPVPFAHPMPDGRAVLAHRSLEATAEGLGADGRAWRTQVGPHVRAFEALLAQAQAGQLVPRRPWGLARLGVAALRSARGWAEGALATPAARALFAGAAAHSFLPLTAPLSAGIGLVLTVSAHAVGWPFVRGGAQALVDALVSLLRALGGEVCCGQPVDSVEALPPARAVLLDVTPRQALRLAGHRFGPRYCRALAAFRYGPAAFKVDWALSGPVPWADPACAQAGTLHLGGTFEEIARAEAQAVRGEVPARPFVLLAQPSAFDPGRAPAGHHVLWGYCHVPHGCPEDMTARIEAQVERFAPGFSRLVLARHTRSPAEAQADNPNLVGGDIAGGAMGGLQVLARPAARPVPWATPDPRIFLCSASTPPGPGVHGMCGWLAARAVLGSPRWRRTPLPRVAAAGAR